MQVAQPSRQIEYTNGEARPVTARHVNLRYTHIVLLVLVCFVSMTTPSFRLFGIPVSFAGPPAIAALMAWNVRRWYRTPFRFVTSLGAAMAIGFVWSIFGETPSMASVALLVVSLGIFTVVANFTLTLLEHPNYQVLAIISLVLKICAVVSVIEIFNYDAFCGIRLGMYSESVASIVCQSARSDAIYAFARPTGFFSEPSNFARFLGIVVTIYAVVSKSIGRTLAWFLFFLALTQSVSFLFCVPALTVVLWAGVESSGTAKSKRKTRRQRTIVVVGMALALLGTFYLQSARIDRAVSTGSSDGSLDERVILPAAYMMEEWDHPIVGSGPTLSSDLNYYVYKIFIFEQGRTWLDPETYKGAFAPSIGLIIAMGMLGVVIFFHMLSVTIGSAGILSGVAFLAMNLLTSGFNSPAMYVPTAIMMAIIWWTTKRRKVAIPTATASRVR